MVKKETLGKIQIWIGIIFLLLAITGIMATIVLFNQEIMGGPRVILPPTSENLTDLEIIQFSSLISMKEIVFISQFEMLEILGVGSLIIFVLSLLFITQGLVNMGEKKRGIPFLRK